MRRKMLEIERQLSDLRFYVWKLRPSDFGLDDAKPVRLKKEHLFEINRRLMILDKSLDAVMEEVK